MNPLEDEPSPSQADTRDPPSLDPKPRERWVGLYRLLERLGSGGMGDVWSAEQTSPLRRKVAIKFVRSELVSDQVLARFELERQALALMGHPNIARVFDAGVSDEGRPYFVMEYVRGIPITSHCDVHRLGTRSRIELFLMVCEGVAHAHQRGVIHRDLKPSNVLVEFVDGRAVPKIIDFGVAKAADLRLIDRPAVTEIGALLGTPEYMSPEQAGVTPQDVDVRTDVYALGVMLYELLTGAMPLDTEAIRQAGYDEMRRRIRETDPTKPSSQFAKGVPAAEARAQARNSVSVTLFREVSGDLDWITLKALERQRERRYPSVSDLAADLVRHTRDEPVVAGPPSAGYRIRKFLRRNRRAVWGVGGVALLLGGLVWLGGRYAHSRSAAEELQEQLRLSAALDSLRGFRRGPMSATVLQHLEPTFERLRAGTATAAEEERILRRTLRPAFSGPPLQETAATEVWLDLQASRGLETAGLSCEVIPEIFCDGQRITLDTPMTYLTFDRHGMVLVPLRTISVAVGAHVLTGKLSVTWLSAERRAMRDSRDAQRLARLPAPTAIPIPPFSYVVVSQIPPTYPVRLVDTHLASEIASAITIEPIQLVTGKAGRAAILEVVVAPGPSTPLVAVEVSVRDMGTAAWIPLLAINGNQGTWILKPSVTYEIERESRWKHTVSIPASLFSPTGEIAEVRVRSDRVVALGPGFGGGTEPTMAFVEVDFVRRVRVRR